MTEKQPGKGASSLPERNWLSDVVKAYMARYLGLRLTSTQVWNGLTVSQQAIIEFAYGEGKGLSTVHKTLMNTKYFTEELSKVDGSGLTTVWVWQERKKPNIVHTTTTPVDEIREGRFRDYDIPATPIEETFPERKSRDGIIEDWGGSPEQDPLRALLVPHEPDVPTVGTVRTFTCIGRFLDDSLVWREDDTGHIGAVTFDAL